MKDNAPANMNLIKNLVLLFMYYFFIARLTYFNVKTEIVAENVSFSNLYYGG